MKTILEFLKTSSIKPKVNALIFASEGTSRLDTYHYGEPNIKFEYSFDGVNWKDWDLTELTIEKGTPLYLRGDNPNGISTSRASYFKFSMYGDNMSCTGNIMHLLDYNNDLDTIPSKYCFYHLFTNCKKLTAAPELPATTLTEGCYFSMFYGCNSLTTIPSILPATTLEKNCYSYMFSCCSNLTTTPDLPAETLVDNCYGYMFQDCKKLNYVNAMFTTTPSFGYTKHWLMHVSSTGAFVKNNKATWEDNSDSSIPNGWKVEITKK